MHLRCSLNACTASHIQLKLTIMHNILSSSQKIIENSVFLLFYIFLKEKCLGHVKQLHHIEKSNSGQGTTLVPEVGCVGVGVGGVGQITK